MRLRQIQDFLAVIEQGSIHAAARKVGLSQPAVTKSLRGLEAELHTQLVRRTNHGVVPTSAGRALYARARAAHAELLKAGEEIAQLSGAGVGSVAFGVGPVAALLVAPEAVTRLHLQYPEASIRIVEGFVAALLPMVRDETLDFAMGPRLETRLDPALSFRPLFREDVVVVGRKGHPLRNAGSLARLGSAKWLGSGLWGGNSPSGPLPRAFLAAGLPLPPQVVQCESYTITFSIIARSDMLGIMSRRFLTAASAKDLLQDISVSYALPSLTVGLFMRKDPPLTPMATAMAKVVTAVARQLATPR
jgi:LysR family transcriptional regulator, regulator of abg operon